MKFQMDDWKELKKIAQNLFKNLEYKQAAEKYVIALQNLVENNSELKNDDPDDDPDHLLVLKTEAAKICSNISLMYFKVWETHSCEKSICYSVEYAKKSTHFDCTWLKGYLRLSIAYYRQNENDNAIDVMLKFMSCAKEKDIELAKPYLKKLKFYTIDKVIQSSPSWNLLNFPDNVYVIDPDGAGHFTSLDRLIAKYGNSISEASILLRPGIYIGTYLLNNSKIDIVGDCSIVLDPVFNAIKKDPPVIFKNVAFPMSAHEAYVSHVKTSSGNPFHLVTFSFYESEIQMKRVTVEELIMSHPIHAVANVGSSIDINQCSIRSMCSASVFTGENSKLSINGSIFVDVFGAVIVAGKNATASLKDCIINNTVGIAVEVRDNAKSIKLDSCKISNTKRQGLVVRDSVKRANVTKCLFEVNNIELTINEGAIQMGNCKAKIEDTIIKKQKAAGIVIENGSGKFSKLTIMNCCTAILVQAGVFIKECNISCCMIGISICQVISDPVVLESNSITECSFEVLRYPKSPMPIIEGKSNHRITEFGLNDVMAGSLMNDYRKARRKKVSKELNIGPVGNFLGISAEKSNLFVSQTSNLLCEYCGYIEAQIGHKLKVCGRCKMAVYCSKSCQEKAWKTHKQICEFYKTVDRAYKDKKHSN